MKAKATKKYLTAVCMSVMLLTGVTGCVKEEAAQTTQEETGGDADREAAGKESGGDADRETAGKESGGEADREAAGKESGGEADAATTQEEADNSAEQNKFSKQEGTEFLPGRVQSVEADGMVVAQTTVMGEGEQASMVTLVDEKDAEKITVKFTADTKVEQWTIQGGGAGIDMQDAALLDLEPGMGVEIEGYYEGEDFVAVKILIEEYE